ncbi:MAG: threonylcarbamoyl-AMP synthase [Bacteroidales bacterium]|nr:threonylcarbamoyl-AMP synthase [Bacteroidales bacterium]
MTEEIKKTIQVLNEGGIILYPTDTIWGIGCDATNPEAVKKIYSIKQREDTKSMLVLLDSENRLSQYVREIPEIAWEILEVSDKPLTIIYPGAKNFAANLIAEDGSIGIRIVRDDFCSKLISRFRKPLVSTSANISGKPAPANFSEIDNAVIHAVDYVVQWRQDDLSKSQASGIIKLEVNGEVKIIRE